jgi:UDP-galactopyranose mutase
MKARKNLSYPEDQLHIPMPRLGFYGVIDERFDIELLRKSAENKPDWHFVMIGPVVKIDPADLPQLPNIHYLGPKTYDELPAYLSGWQMALIPFLLNDATRYISPTKTPEYLAAGVPVVSTAIEDVINPYGKHRLAHIVGSAGELISACEKQFAMRNKNRWLNYVDEFLSGNSWNNTWRFMKQRIKETRRKPATVIKMEQPVLSTIIKSAVNV